MLIFEILKKHFRKNFFQFINLIKSQGKFENKTLILDSGSSAKKQDLKYRKINVKIENLTKDYDNKLKTNLQFLDSICQSIFMMIN